MRNYIYNLYMNIHLYYSSAIIGTLLLLVSLIRYVPQLATLYQITYVGIITSIVNHMDTNDIAKYVDRFIMVLGTFIYAYYVFFMKSKPRQIIIVILLCIAVLFYLSKFAKQPTDVHLIDLPDYVPPFSQTLHILTQWIVLFAFIIIIYDYSMSQNVL
jgi:hypothetical protein